MCYKYFMTKIFHQTCYLIKNKFFLIITLFLFITSLSGIAFSETKTSNENSLYEQRNEKEAFKWYKKAAEQGNKEIFYQLEALAKKNNPALSALKVVAKKGNSEAQLYLGFYYSDQENKQETVKWFTKSAEQRNDSAQYYLGNIITNKEMNKKLLNGTKKQLRMERIYITYNL